MMEDNNSDLHWAEALFMQSRVNERIAESVGAFPLIYDPSIKFYNEPSDDGFNAPDYHTSYVMDEHGVYMEVGAIDEQTALEQHAWLSGYSQLYHGNYRHHFIRHRLVKTMTFKSYLLETVARQNDGRQ